MFFIHSRLTSHSAAENPADFQPHRVYPQQLSAVRNAVDFSTSSLPRHVGSTNRNHHSSSYHNSTPPTLPGHNARLPNGRLGTVSPFDITHSPSLGWRCWDHNISSPENSAGPMPVAAVNLPLRRHLAHVPLNAVTDYFPSGDNFRYSSCREHTVSHPSTFHRIMSLPTRHNRRHTAVPARSAQV